MKLFKKFLSTIISVGMLFSVASLSVFAIPTNLDECCAELDRILSQEDKDKIKQSVLGSPGDYDYIPTLAFGALGGMILHDWLCSNESNSGVGHGDTALATLLLDHGVDFEGSESGFTMVSVILENYHHYLVTGRSAPSIEDLAIDHWFRVWARFEQLHVKRDTFQRQLEKEKKLRASRKNKNSQCSIM